MKKVTKAKFHRVTEAHRVRSKSLGKYPYEIGFYLEDGTHVGTIKEAYKNIITGAKHSEYYLTKNFSK